ncbi:MAG: hypothetical protein AAF390_09330 [Pseudomonadota bacterium]
MQVRVTQFIDFAYGDKRRDRAKVNNIISDLGADYDPARDRYRKFREAMKSFEEGRMPTEKFLTLHSRVASNKAAGYKVLCQNYLDMKEDHALIWQGRSPLQADISGLRVTAAWYLRTEANNQTRIIYLHFGKDQLPRKKERGLLTVLRLARPESAGVGVLNIQSGTLTTATRLDQVEADYLKQRASKFMTLAGDI